VPARNAPIAVFAALYSAVVLPTTSTAAAQRLRGALEPLGRYQSGYAEGVVIADALCGHDAPASLGELVDVPVAAVARALLFRMATTNERVASDGVDLRDEARRYSLAAIGL
jgi:hypothetical protein